MQTKFAPWLLTSRVSPPRISINANRRDKLLDQLTENRHKRVMVIEAPAGFGKTLLLSQWREIMKFENHTVAWFSINTTDPADTILPYLAFAFHHAGLDMHDSGLLEPGHNQGHHSYLLGNLLRLIEEQQDECIIIFDDFENISEECIEEIVAPLVNQQPGNLQLVFACRKNPGLSLSNLAVEGNVLHIGPQELMFSRDEVDHFFQRKISQKELDNIISRTAGWPVALQLLRSFGTTTTTPEDLDTISGNRLLNDYFREQLLDNLSQSERLLLLETSLLETITIECADYIRETDDSSEIIHGLHYLEGIVSPLEDELEAWRIHPLVREHLLQELKESSPDNFRSICRRTASWMADNDRGLDAMRYALDANEPELAANILEQMGGIMLWIKEGMSRLTQGLQLIAAYELDNHPRIHLGRCLILTKQGHMHEARQAFEKARQISNDFQHDRLGGDDALLMIERYSVEIMLAEYGCTPAHPILPAEAFKFMLDNTREEPAIHGYIKTLQCLTSLQVGEFEACKEHGKYAIREYLTGHSSYGELFIYFYFGMADLAQGKTADALNNYNRAWQMIHSDFPGDTGLKLLANAVIAEACFETGDLKSTRKHLRQVIKNIGAMESYFDIYMSTYHTASTFLLFENGKTDAIDFVERALNRARNQSLRRLEEFLVCLQVSILYFANEYQAALDIVKVHPAIFGRDALSLAGMTWREVEAFTLALNRVGRMSGDPARYEAVQREALGVAGETGNTRMLINFQLQDALNASQGDMKDRAEQKLRAAAELAAPGNYLGPFINELPGLVTLLEPAIDNARDADRNLLTQLLDVRGQQNPIPGTAREFSQREIQILAELAQGQPDKLIARQTGLSAHGVRYHLKNIYAKMGVDNRVQAISRARELELI